MSSALELVPLDKPFDLYANGRTVVLIAAGSMLALSTICVSLRFCGRFLLKASWAWDDTLVIIAYICITSCNILGLWAVGHAGGGMHVLLIGFDTLRKFLKTMYAFEILFLGGLAWTRFAVIALYYRLFKISVWVRRALWTMVVLNGIWWITTEMFVVFTCTPVWSLWIWEEQQSCLSIPIFFSSICISNIVLDLVTILMPIMVLRNLHMPFRKKCALGGLFGFSLICPVISAFRLNEMLFAVKTNILHTDPTFAMTGTAFWCMIELSVGISVSCVPSMRPVFRLMAGKPIVSPMSKPLKGTPVEKLSRNTPSSDRSSKPKLPVLTEEQWTFDSGAEPVVWTPVSGEKFSPSKGITVSHEVEIHSSRMSPV